jgi:hypothetical protein
MKAQRREEDIIQDRLQREAVIARHQFLAELRAEDRKKKEE